MFTDSSQWYLFCVSEMISTKHQNRRADKNCTKNNINILLYYFVSFFFTLWTTRLYTAACLIVTNHNNAQTRVYRTSECYNSIQTKTIKPKNFPIHCICAHTTTISTNKPTHMYSASTMMLLVDFSYQQESYKFTHIHPLLYS